MARKRYIRKRRGTAWTPESSARANRARWAADRARREAEEPERMLALAEIEAENLPRNRGDMLGTLSWSDAATGKVRRWVVRIGDRCDRITLEAPGGQATRSHGWTWALNQIRHKLCA